MQMAAGQRTPTPAPSPLPHNQPMHSPQPTTHPHTLDESEKNNSTRWSRIRGDARFDLLKNSAANIVTDVSN